MQNAELNLKDYMHLWGARQVPFHDNDELKLFETEQHQRIRELLQQTAALRSVMLLSGDNGVGKSALVAQWIQELSPKLYAPLVITQATLSASAVLATLVGKLGRTPSMFRSRNIKEIEEALPRLGRLTPVLVLDEAQNYSPSSIEEVRLLLGLNLPQQPLFALILVGDNYLLDTLRLQSRRPLYSRIATAYHMEPLTYEQTRDFLVHSAETAGIQRDCFDDHAMQMIAMAADGIPRTIQLIARSAWCEASRQRETLVHVKHVEHALQLIPVARDKVATAIHGVA